jgi:hypothetical protein
MTHTLGTPVEAWHEGAVIHGKLWGISHDSPVRYDLRTDDKEIVVNIPAERVKAVDNANA